VKHALVKFQVLHKRFVPKKYEFLHSFFWFKIDLNSIDKWPTKLFSRNKFNLYSFYDDDHLKLGKDSARENFIEYARSQGLNTPVKNVEIYTQVRFLGYVFNPISLIFLEDEKGLDHCIIQIGNTFNELKPFFANNDHFKNNELRFNTKKYFYISPFIDHDSEMGFLVKRDKENLFIEIEDSKNGEKVLNVYLKGQEVSATTFELIKRTLVTPFVTFKIIFLIHYHALVLWMKGLPYFKKDEHKHLQRGTMIWKTSKNSTKKT
jgi:DUF1365 family protein